MTRRTASDPLIRLLLSLTTLMAAAVLGIAYFLLFPRHIADGAASTGPGAACDVNRPDHEVCNPDEWCIRGTCLDRAPLPVAKLGESCRERLCEPPHLACGPDHACYPKEGPLPPPPHCEDRRVREAVERLVQECGKRTQNLKDIGEDPMGCNASVWETLTASDADIDLILSAFPDRFAVVFPRARPQQRAHWPTDGGEFLLSQLRPFKQRLASAHKIFVIGRASPDGDARGNYALTLRRIDLFESMVKKLLQEELRPSEVAANPLFLSWGVKGEEMLSLPSFIEHYVGPHAPFTFEPGAQTWLRDKLDRYRAGQTLAQREIHELEQAVNRAVLVVPILCDARALEQQ